MNLWPSGLTATVMFLLALKRTQDIMSIMFLSTNIYYFQIKDLKTDYGWNFLQYVQYHLWGMHCETQSQDSN